MPDVSDSIASSRTESTLGLEPAADRQNAAIAGLVEAVSRLDEDQINRVLDYAALIADELALPAAAGDIIDDLGDMDFDDPKYLILDTLETPRCLQ